MNRYRRHPAEVTADRLSDAYERYYDLMDGAEREALSHVAHALREIAEGKR